MSNERKKNIALNLWAMLAFLLCFNQPIQAAFSTIVGIQAWDSTNGYWSRIGINSDYGLEVRSISTEFSHHELHEGDSFATSHNATLGSGSKFFLMVNAPAGADIAHIVHTLRASGEANIEVWEGGTVSNIGTVLISNNRNRNAATSSLSLASVGPTVTNWGTKLSGFTGHVGNGQTIGGEDRGTSEIMLKTGAITIYNVTSEAASNDITLVLDSYFTSTAY